MANLSISMQGISIALSDLGYKENSKKFKLVSAINSYYVSEESISNVISIDTDALIKKIWNLEDEPLKIKSKRRNFNSIKSSINKDLLKLSKKGKNPENIILSDLNTFDMSEEAKSKLLNTFSDSLKTGDIDIDQAGSILGAIKSLIDNLESEDEKDKSKDLLQQIGNALEGVSENLLKGEGTGKAGITDSYIDNKTLSEKESAGQVKTDSHEKENLQQGVYSVGSEQIDDSELEDSQKGVDACPVSAIKINKVE